VSRKIVTYATLDSSSGEETRQFGLRSLTRKEVELTTLKVRQDKQTYKEDLARYVYQTLEKMVQNNGKSDGQKKCGDIYISLCAL